MTIYANVHIVLRPASRATGETIMVETIVVSQFGHSGSIVHVGEFSRTLVCIYAEDVLALRRHCEKVSDLVSDAWIVEAVIASTEDTSRWLCGQNTVICSLRGTCQSIM